MSTHPDKLLDTQGNVQVLPNGNVLVGWGSAPHFSEFDHHGKLLTPPTRPKASPTGPSASREQPTDDPAIVVELGAEDE